MGDVGANLRLAPTSLCPNSGDRWLPTGKAELLCLLLHVLVVERCAVGCAPQSGADLHGDLFELRTLDRREELERRRGRSILLEVR